LGLPKNVSIHSLLIAQNWESALNLIEGDEGYAQEWFFGVDDRLDPDIDDISSSGDQTCVVWKRLAIHLACVYRAPVGLVEVLLKAYPKGATCSDPHSGSLPLHLACQHRASFRVIKALLVHAPATAKAVDNRGRLALHYAVLAKAHYAIVELLVEMDPNAVLAKDKDQKTPLDMARDTFGGESINVRLLEMISLVLQKPKGALPPLKTINSGDTVCF
jgi:hypothetical protein